MGCYEHVELPVICFRRYESSCNPCCRKFTDLVEEDWQHVVRPPGTDAETARRELLLRSYVLIASGVTDLSTTNPKYMRVWLVENNRLIVDTDRWYTPLSRDSHPGGWRRRSKFFLPVDWVICEAVLADGMVSSFAHCRRSDRLLEMLETRVLRCGFELRRRPEPSERFARKSPLFRCRWQMHVSSVMSELYRDDPVQHRFSGLSIYRPFWHVILYPPSYFPIIP